MIQALQAAATFVLPPWLFARFEPIEEAELLQVIALIEKAQNANANANALNEMKIPGYGICRSQPLLVTS